MGRRFAWRAVRLAVLVFVVCVAAIVIALALGALTQRLPGVGELTVVRAAFQVLTLLLYAVALPTIPIAGWVSGPDYLEVPVVLAMGSLIWGALIAAVWTAFEWLRERRR